uniref:TPR_REGION domain-containing protein n=1 Tax=Steinernema glaseri TaxID=37863 RepID=A0A1I7ZSA7_9BILA
MAVGQLVTSAAQPLPAKEAGLFRKLVKAYESKNYKSGIKISKQILDKHPDHGETLSMKSLILNCQGKVEEARVLVKTALKCDLKSHICWHVYGLIQRAEKKNEEAMKAYKRALAIDVDNTQILRDLSLLQVQMRDYEGYRDSRFRLLKLRSGARMSWISYATSYHLLKNYTMAIQIINTYINNNKPEGAFDYEHSELLMYQNMLYREAGKPEEALTQLQENCSWIVDKLAYHENRAELLFETGKLEEAEKVYWMLVQRNPERELYYKMIEKCRGLDEGNTEERLKIYEEATVKYPRAGVPQRLPLLFVEGEELRKRLVKFIIKGAQKGVPSLSKNLIALYSSPAKVAIIESILLDFVHKLEENGKGYLDGCNLPESPTTVLWIYYFLAQHFDRIGSYTQAMQYIKRAKQHTPTLIELLMAEAKILKHMGDFNEAAKCMIEAQSLDTADRYLNCKCVKYLLRAGQIKEAEDMCGKFTRENTNPSDCLTEMQCMWYEVERARAYNKMGNYGQALVNCHLVNNHFETFYEDQYDFHSYCVRKMTVSSYVKLLRLEDVMRFHHFYVDAMKVAVQVYLRKLDRPSDFITEKLDEINENMTAAEITKAKRKANKDKARKAAAAAEEAKKQQKNQKKNEDAVEGVVMEKLDPEKLLAADPLQEAANLVSFIMRLDQVKDLEAFILGFEVYLRKDKVLLMLQALNRAAKIDPDHPLLHAAKIKFLKYYKEKTFEGHVATMVKFAVEKLFSDSVDPSELNEAYKAAHISSLPHRIAVAQSNVVLNASSSEVNNWLLKSLDDEKLQGVTLTTCSKLYEDIKYGRLGEWTKEETGQFVKRCQQLFKSANIFGAPSI